jgi:demethylmenaquinone methyltransferase/2-methoxy-6-polyprenyl-1,4-benzoquinol methylase
MTSFRLKSNHYIHQPDGKLQFNRELFAAIAPEYGRMSGVLSLGQDRRWKQALVAALPERVAPVCLDLASGNGDLAALLLDRYPDAEVTALDLTEPMLDLARDRFGANPRIVYRQADMTATALPTESFDLITVGYGLRNAPDLDQALAEIARLLRPGGIVATLDFSRWNRASSLELALLGFWCGLWGLIRSGNADTYGYIADSLAQYPRREALHRQFARHGLLTTTTQLHFLGVIEIIIAAKHG